MDLEVGDSSGASDLDPSFEGTLDSREGSPAGGGVDHLLSTPVQPTHVPWTLTLPTVTGVGLLVHRQVQW